MVRKWSYIENKSNCYHITPFSKLKRLSKKHSFKVFRKTTRFRKYKLGLTRSVRRWYTRKRRKTSLYTNSHILYSWIRYYLKCRQFIRFTQSIGLSPVSGYLGNADFAVKNSRLQGAPYGFHSYSCTYRVLNKSIYFTNNIFPNTVMLICSKNSFIQFLDCESASNSNDLHTNVLVFDRLCYPIDVTISTNETSKTLLDDFGDLVFKLTTLNVVEFKKMIILLTLLNTCTNI